MQLVTREDAKYLRVGQEVILRSNATVHPEAKYYGTIVQLTDDLIVLDTRVIQHTMNEKNMVLGEQTKLVKYSIKKNDLCVDTLMWLQ